MLFVYFIHLCKEGKERNVMSGIFTAQIIPFCSEKSKLQIIFDQIVSCDLVRLGSKKVDLSKPGLYVKSPSQNNSLSFLLQKALVQKIRHDYVSLWWEINDVSTYLLLLNYTVDPVMTAYNQTNEVKENWPFHCNVWWYEETEEPIPKCCSSWKSCCIIIWDRKIFGNNVAANWWRLSEARIVPLCFSNINLAWFGG